MKKNSRKKKNRYNPNEWDETKSVAVDPEPRMKTGISTSIRLPREMVNKLKKSREKKVKLATRPSLRYGSQKGLKKKMLKF